MEQTTQTGNNQVDRKETVEATIQAFVELVLIQKFADMPAWLSYDLTVSQVRAIYFLAAHEKLTVSDLARLLEMGRPAASILVQQLVEGELVGRSEDPDDRRRSWVKLTARGAGLVSGRREQREMKFRVWLGRMSDEDLACLLQGASALLKEVRKEQPLHQIPSSG
jgi:DNA-binding MarR family transcriptional regulator